jgi:hypothetical protein
MAEPWGGRAAGEGEAGQGAPAPPGGPRSEKVFSPKTKKKGLFSRVDFAQAEGVAPIARGVGGEGEAEGAQPPVDGTRAKRANGGEAATDSTSRSPIVSRSAAPRRGVSNTPSPNTTDRQRQRDDGPSDRLGEDGSEPLPPNTGARALTHRLDALVVGCRVAIDPSIWQRLCDAKTAARVDGGATYEVVGVPFAVDKRASSSGPGVRLRNADATILVNSCETYDDRGRYAGPGWTVEVSLRAAYLATHRRREAYAFVRAIALSFAPAGAPIVAERVRRVDLCTDVAGASFTTDDRGSFLTRSRRVSDYRPELPPGVESWDEEARATQTHWKHGASIELTGFTFSAGNPFMARVYDKSAELARYEDGHEKPAIEHAAWTAAGWSGDRVWRVEFQARRESLEEMRIHTLDDLEENLDPIWQYAVSKWLRLVKRECTRKERAPLDPRWIPLLDVRFAADAAPARRVRAKRGGPSKAQTIGTVQNYLASLGLDANPIGADGMPKTAEALLEENVLAFARHVAITHGPRYLAVCAAAHARFASVDDINDPRSEAA